MSADNYWYIDYRPEEHPGYPWSLTMGFESNEQHPQIGPNTGWYETLSSAIAAAEMDWTEYGYEMSPAALDQARQIDRQKSARTADAAAELELIDDAFCDIIHDRYQDLTPGVRHALISAIDRLQAWRKANGYEVEA